MHPPSSLCFAVLAPLTLLLACAHTENAPATPTTTTSAHVVSNENAVQQLAKARCNREAECHNIGNGRYGTDDECRDAARHEGNAILTDYACPAGVEKGQLDKCIAVLRDQMCHNPMEPVALVDECHTGPLCAKYRE